MLLRAYRYSLLLLLLASCDTRSPAEQEHAYQAALAAASTQPTYPLAVSGLRFGMTAAQVHQHVDSLRQRDELCWHFSTGCLPMQVYYEFTDDRLTMLGVVLRGPGLTNTVEYLELQRGLEQAYGESYPHGDWTRSWFKGGAEVQLVASPEYGYILSYLDLHHPTQPYVDRSL